MTAHIYETTSAKKIHEREIYDYEIQYKKNIKLGSMSIGSVMCCQLQDFGGVMYGHVTVYCF